MENENTVTVTIAADRVSVTAVVPTAPMVPGLGLEARLAAGFRSAEDHRHRFPFIATAPAVAALRRSLTEVADLLDEDGAALIARGDRTAGARRGSLAIRLRDLLSDAALEAFAAGSSPVQPNIVEQNSGEGTPSDEQ